MATRSIEEVAAASGDGRRWFQVYVWRDRALVRDMVERAAAAGYEALVITVDTANLGRRERDVRRGFTLPPEARPRHDPRRHRPPGLDVALRPLRADPVRQRRHVEGRRQPVRRLAPDRASPRRCRRSSTRHCRGPTSSGSARSGTGRSCSRACSRSPTPASPSSTGSRRSPCPTTAAASSTAPRRSSNSSLRSPTRSAVASRSSATAACGGGATSSRHWRSAPTRAWPGGRTSTGSARPASSASIGCSSGCSTSYAARWP